MGRTPAQDGRVIKHLPGGNAAISLPAILRGYSRPASAGKDSLPSGSAMTTQLTSGPRTSVQHAPAV